MKLLILGGTRFLGRHCVEEALARGHDVTIFTRGVQPVPWAGRVTRLVGNRDPRIAPGLAALGSGEWDAAIDMSGYVPRCVGASVAALERRVGHYTFVSSISVYANADLPRDESTPLLALDDPQSEDVIAHYGALKARCEDEVRAVFGGRALVVRPGLIVGPHDPTDRFAYWVARFACPEVLGDRPEAAVVPAPPGRAIQFIDARDLAAWTLDLIDQRDAGTFDACSPAGLWTMGELVEVLQAAGSRVVPRWIDDETLLRHDVVPWTGLPLWLPASDPESAGFMEWSAARAAARGLAPRPLAETVADTAAWLRTRDHSAAWRNVLPADRERAILADGRGSPSP